MHDITRYVMTNRDAPILDGVDREATAAALSAAIVRTALGVRGYRQAQQQEEFFKALGDNAKASKLRERMPDRFRVLVEKYTENGPLQNVYVPADRFQQYFQSVGMDPVQVARDVGVTNYDEALATGGDLAIPMADFATVIAPTDHLQGLMEDLRLRQEDMTPREAREFERRRKEWEADILEQVKATSARRRRRSSSRCATGSWANWRGAALSARPPKRMPTFREGLHHDGAAGRRRSDDAYGAVRPARRHADARRCWPACLGWTRISTRCWTACAPVTCPSRPRRAWEVACRVHSRCRWPAGLGRDARH